MNVNQKIIKLRQLLGQITQFELSKIIDVDQSTISTWQSGKRIPSRPAMFGIDNILKCESCIQRLKK